MRIVLRNFVWMPWNIFLALIAVYFSSLTVKTKDEFKKAVYLLIAILFIPNTIYIATDLAHIYKNWLAISENYLKPVLIIQYLIFIPIGIITFLKSVTNIEEGIEKLLKLRRKDRQLSISLLNFLVSFGVVIGRVQRANSWEVLTNPLKIYENVLKTFQSRELMTYVIVFGVFLNITYFAFTSRNDGVGERT